MSAAPVSAAAGAATLVAATAPEHATQHPAETAERIVAPLALLGELSSHQPRVVIVIAVDLATTLLPHPAAQLAPLLPRQAAEGFGSRLLELLR
jgi:hypothetical protein